MYQRQREFTKKWDEQRGDHPWRNQRVRTCVMDLALVELAFGGVFRLLWYYIPGASYVIQMRATCKPKNNIIIRATRKPRIILLF